MAFIFSTSHLPETRVRRPDHLEDEEEDQDTQPLPRAGGVRAISHLPPARALADSSSPLSTRPATPVGRPRPYIEPEDDQDTAHAPSAEFGHDDDTRAHAEYADDTLWHSPRITTQDQPPESHQEDDHAQEEGDHPAPSMHRDSSRTRSSGFSPSPQDLRDAFHSPAQDNRPALPGGRLSEQHSAPEAFLTQLMGKGASGLPRQQNLQGSERILAALQQPVRGATQAAPAGRLAAQQQAQPPAGVPAQNMPANPQPPAAGSAKRPPCADCQAKLDDALMELCKLEAELHAIRAEIGNQFRIAEEADKEWYAANAKGDDAAGRAAILKEARANATIKRLQDSLFAPGSKRIHILQEIDALRSCIHSDPFEQQ